MAKFNIKSSLQSKKGLKIVISQVNKYYAKGHEMASHSIT